MSVDRISWKDHITSKVRFRAFLFDLDGVLVNSYECWWHLLQGALKQQGLQPVSREAFDAAWGQDPEADQRMFFPNWNVSGLLQFYDSNFGSFATYVKSDPEAIEVLRALKEQGRLIGVASNSTPKIVDALLRETSLSPYVDVQVGVDETIKGKPDPALILTAMRKLNVGPGEVCYIGDSIFDEQAARAVGVRFVGYKRSGDVRIDRLTELVRIDD